MIQIATSQSQQHADQGTAVSWWQQKKSKMCDYFSLLREAWKVDIHGGFSKELQSVNNMRLHFGFALACVSFMYTIRSNQIDQNKEKIENK